ncbi:MAG: SpoIIE family protein phosphatase [Monoglobales bacterium]
MKTDEIITYKRKPGRSDRIIEIFSHSSTVAATMAIMISRVTVLGSMAPFGIAWYVANICDDKYYTVLLSAVAGTLLIGTGASKISHIFAILLLIGLKRVFSPSSWNRAGFVSVAAAVCTLISGLVFSFFSGTFYYSILTSFADALIAGGMCIVFSKASCVISHDWKIANDEDSVAIAIMAGAVVAGLQGISIFGIKPANVLSMYIILFTAYKGGIGISGATGAALGIIAGISQGDAPALTGVYGFMGLASGVMNLFGKMGVVLSAAFANSLFAGYYNSSTIVLVNLIEIAAAGLIFFFTPGKVLCYFEKFSIRPPVYDAAGGFVMRLKSSIGEALASLKISASAIAEAYAPTTSTNIVDSKKLISERLIARVCDGCSLNKYCWSKNISGSNLMFEKITAALFEENFNTLNEHISGRCVRGDTLCDTAKELYGVLKRENIINRRVDFYAKNFAEGWADYLEIIENKEEKIVNIRPDFASLEGELCRELTAGGIKSPEISMIMNDCGRFEITLRTSKEILFDIIPAAEKLTGRKMCVSDEYRTKTGFVMKLQESLRFDYDVSIITMNKDGSDESGDNTEWFVTPDGIFYCIVCDGMGSGKQANEDSSRVIKLFKTLILSGFKPASVLKIINGGLISSSIEERCVTFDCLTVDLFTGRAEFTKAGAVASIVKTGNEVSIIRENTMPLGVLSIDSCPQQTMFLGGDSYIVMMTDGITDNIGDRSRGEECVGSILKLMEVSSGKEIADNIMMSAVAEGIPKDDMMVTAIKISGKDI